MRIKTYEIIIHKGNETKKTSCTSLSLNRLVDDFIKEDGEVLCIAAYNQKKAKKKIEDVEKIVKEKYYNAKYTLFYKKFKANKISKEKFEEVVETLKQLKRECETKEEFEIRFEEYKKTLTIIP